MTKNVGVVNQHDKNKPISVSAYEWCKINTKISGVCLVSNDLSELSLTEEHFVKIIENNDNDECRPDLIISLLYPNKIKEPILSYAKLGCINFHPAPLPEYKGVAPYTKGIIDGVDTWGVSAHYIDEEIDTGDIIKINKFHISNQETSKSLSLKSHKELYKLFTEVVGMFINGIVTRKKQIGGTYFSKKDFELLREVKKDDSATMIERKIRAFWCPPHEGAYCFINGFKVFSIPKCEIHNMERE